MNNIKPKFPYLLSKKLSETTHLRGIIHRETTPRETTHLPNYLSDLPMNGLNGDCYRQISDATRILVTKH